MREGAFPLLTPNRPASGNPVLFFYLLGSYQTRGKHASDSL
jgi:hypothetical protein